MICDKCNAIKEMDIVRTEFCVTGDQSASMETMLYNVPFYVCNNKECPAFNEEKRGEPIPIALTQI